jgi:SWI/SNF-related matrix-associated actin-dependent regulator of chromatin subfamily D
VFGGADSVNFYNLPELVNRFLAPPDPVVVQYTINPAAPPPEKPQAWDIEVKVEDLALKSKMSAMLQVSKDTQAELSRLDEEVYAFSLFFGDEVSRH